eukprot:2890662-Rhodomonas_salina.2
MSGTDVAYGATRRARVQGMRYAISPCVRYAMPGIDAYAATRALYMRCPVLTYGILLRVCYAKPGTGIQPAATTMLCSVRY